MGIYPEYRKDKVQYTAGGLTWTEYRETPGLVGERTVTATSWAVKKRKPSSMSTFTKTYPRALVKPHPKLHGWTIDLIQRAGAKPKRVAATYSSIPFAFRAARLKLGLPVSPRAAKDTQK